MPGRRPRREERSLRPAQTTPKKSLPPGPAAPPVVQTLRWLRRPVELLEDCRRRYGDVFSLKFLGFGSPMVLLSDPEVVGALYGEREQLMPPLRSASLEPIMGAGSLLLLEGAQHLERRRLMLPQFHGEALRRYEATMREIAEREIAGWAVGSDVVLHEAMRRVTLEVILRVVFGVSDEQRRARLRELVPALLAKTSSAALSFRVLAARRLGLTNPLERLGAEREEIDRLLYEEIAQRRRDGANDVLSLLAAARFEDGAPLSERELRDHLMTLLLAGHETTATALAWTFELLLRSPEVLTRARERDEDYLRAVCSEALRLRPVVPLAGRRLARELRAGRYVLPAGTDVTPAIWLLHTREDLYPQPYEFRPERFLHGAPASYAWIPFGGGVRRCLGAAFAELEMRVVLAAVLERVELRALRREPERIARRNITFAPAHGTPVRVLALRDAGRPAPAAAAA